MSSRRQSYPDSQSSERDVTYLPNERRQLTKDSNADRTVQREPQYSLCNNDKKTESSNPATQRHVNRPISNTSLRYQDKQERSGEF